MSSQKQELSKVMDRLGWKSEIEGEMMNIFSKERNPLRIIEQNKSYFVLLGNNRVSEIFNNHTEAVEDAERKDLERILQLAHIASKVEYRESLKKIKVNEH